MAEEIGALRVVLQAGVGQFISDMGKAQAAVNTTAARMKRSMARVGDGFSSVGRSIGGWNALMVAATAAAGGVALVMKRAIDTGGALYDLSQKTGISGKALSTLSYAAKMAGVDADSFEKALVKLSVTASAAAHGNEEAAKTFEALKIKVKDAQGNLKPIDTLLLEVANKMDSMGASGERAALAVRVFGKAGAGIIPMFEGGAAAIQAARDQARAFGIEMSDELIKACDDFGDSISSLNYQLTGLGATLLGPILPGLNNLISKFNEGRVAGEGFFTALYNAAINTAQGGEYQIALARLEKMNEVRRKYEEAKASGGSWFGGIWDTMTMPQIDISDEAFAAQYKKVQELYQKELDLRVAQKEAHKKRRDESALDLNALDKTSKAVGKQQSIYERTLEQLREEGELRKDATRVEQFLAQMKGEDWNKTTQQQRDEILGLAASLDAAEAIAKRRAAIEKFTREDALETSQALLELREEEQQKSIDQINAYWDGVKDVFQGWNAAAADAMTEFCLTGKARFHEFAMAVVRDILRMQLAAQMSGLFQSLALSFGTSIVPGAPTGGGPPVGAPPVPGRKLVVPSASLGALSKPVLSLPQGAGAAAPQSVRIVNVLDPQVVNDWASSPAGERVIMNVISRNATQVRQRIGG